MSHVRIVVGQLVAMNVERSHLDILPGSLEQHN